MDRIFCSAATWSRWCQLAVVVGFFSRGVIFADDNPQVDLNSNGLSDVWERVFGVIGLEPDGDSDGDGFRNWEESLAGTDPLDRNSQLAINYEFLLPGYVQLSCPEPELKEYRVLATNDLTGDWNLVESHKDRVPFVCEIAAEEERGFYRVEVRDLDSDLDGVSDWEELELGLDRFHAHTDRFPLTDYERVSLSLAEEPVVSLHVMRGVTYEGWPVPAVLVIRRSGGLDPLSLSLLVEGTASEDDFQGPISGVSVQLPAGYSDMYLVYVPESDEVAESEETLAVSILPGDGYSLGASSSATIRIYDQDAGVSPYEASRLLAQASFGATIEMIAEVQGLGVDGWIESQMALEPSLMQPLAEAVDAIDEADSSISFRHDDEQVAWWHLALDAEDQLRQRVAFALSEILVVSDDDGRIYPKPIAMANYYDVLVRNAFGNYRDLLEEVTYHPIMGVYLGHRGNRSWDAASGKHADENYAREIMQLFTVGLWMLNTDGTPVLDAHGDPIPTYSNDEIVELAKVFTGMNWGGNDTLSLSGFSSWAPSSSYRIPMEIWEGRSIDEATGEWLPYQQTVDGELVEFYLHDRSEKHLLSGVVLPAGQTGAEDIDQALDALFNHPNVGPFLAIRLIQRLVKSNPSAAYVGRVATVFNDNGLGVRGDLAAVVQAILLDPEARDFDAQLAEDAGKLREPLMVLVQLARVFRASSASGVYLLHDRESIFSQQPLSAPTVFNFFEPGYCPPGGVHEAGLVAPEFQILNATTAISIPNHLYWATHGDIGYKGGDYDVHLDYSPELVLAVDQDALIEYLDLLLTYGTLGPSEGAIICSALQRRSDQGRQLSEMVDLAVYLLMTSPDYMVQL